MKKIITKAESINKIINSFARTTDEIFSLEELRELLSSGRQLCIKYGVDVTAPDIHIGHAVNLWMLRKLQELGHKVVFLIGDFTTQIGDPSGKNKLRPVIPIDEIKRNTKAFMQQSMMVLHDNSEVYQVRKNSEWYDEMPAKQLLSLMSIITHDRLVSREMFRRRIKEGKEIYEHELVYPILQAYDSVILEADLTIIGSDQLFNEMLGRFFQERYNQKPQVIITTKITPGIDGKQKQSKSIGNYIGLNHSPREKFGRIMSMPDPLIIDYFRVYTEMPLDDINAMELGLKKDPMKYKLMLAKEIVSRYHDSKSAEEENEWFIKTFRQKETPKDLPVVCLDTDKLAYFDIIRKCFAAEKKSNSEIKRLFKQGAIRFDGKAIKDPYEIALITSEGNIVKVGSRIWFKVALCIAPRGKMGPAS